MKKTDQNKNVGQPDLAFHGLYKAGAVAALAAALIFRRNLDAEWMLIRGSGLVDIGPATPPGTIREWYALLQQHPLLGLTFLNVLDLANYALVGAIILALVIALRKTSPSMMAAAAGLGGVGITLYLASNQAFTMLSISQQYASASDAERPLFLAAGQAALAIHQNVSYLGPGMYLSFLLVSAAGLMISGCMLKSSFFSKGAAWMGILANGLQLCFYPVRLFAPALVAIPISISAIFLLVWYIQVGVRLWGLGASPALKMERKTRNGSPLFIK